MQAVYNFVRANLPGAPAKKDSLAEVTMTGRPTPTSVVGEALAGRSWQAALLLRSLSSQALARAIFIALGLDVSGIGIDLGLRVVDGVLDGQRDEWRVADGIGASLF